MLGAAGATREGQRDNVKEMPVAHDETTIPTESYEPPAIEQVVTAEDLVREIHYAGPGQTLEPDGLG
jgi:hypothetical protein